MEQLFAPWRIEWVERDDRNANIDGCVFCELPTRATGQETGILAASDGAYVLLNNYPYNPGHVMVVPRPHTAEFSALDDDVLLDHAKMKARTFEALRVGLDPDGFNAGCNLGEASGGSIRDHLHTHVVPRWAGDTNFMPVIGDTKVIVEAVEATYDRLREAFAGLDGAARTGDSAAVHFGD